MIELIACDRHGALEEAQDERGQADVDEEQ